MSLKWDGYQDRWPTQVGIATERIWVSRKNVRMNDIPVMLFKVKGVWRIMEVGEDDESGTKIHRAVGPNLKLAKSLLLLLADVIDDD